VTDQSFLFTPCDPGVNLGLWGTLLAALGEAAKDEGFDLYFKESTGFGRVWVRPRAQEPSAGGR
jgi:hypothetical protein